MPIDKKMKCPYCAEWPVFNEISGQTTLRTLHPEEIIANIALGYTTSEICEQFEAPIKAVEHIISMIPFMMAWRDMVLPAILTGPEQWTPEQMDQDLSKTVFYGPKGDGL